MYYREQIQFQSTVHGHTGGAIAGGQDYSSFWMGWIEAPQIILTSMSVCIITISLEKRVWPRHGEYTLPVRKTFGVWSYKGGVLFEF
jgi:hypothetical protein